MLRTPLTTILLLATTLLAATQAHAALVDVDLVDRDTGQWLPETPFRGDTWVAGAPGHRYAVRLANTSGERVLVVLSVDGVNAVTGAEDEDVAYAVAMVTLFGTAAMLLYPLIDHWLMLDARRYGLWAGASIHEVAQVVGATAQVGPAATQSGAIAKLTRVLMLAPLVMTLRFERRKAEAGNTGAAVPLFVIGFLALVAVNSLIALPHELTALAGQISGFLLAVALGAMGLKTHINGLKAKGWAPLALGAFGTVFISLFTLGLTLAFA